MGRRITLIKLWKKIWVQIFGKFWGANFWGENFGVKKIGIKFEGQKLRETNQIEGRVLREGNCVIFIVTGLRVLKIS